eukprot:COSAG02_NODE_16533_length_1076_cov_1.328557_1_plen_308_part_00
MYASDQGVEFKGGFTDATRQDLLDAGLITSGDRFVHRLNLASAPTQATHIERLWSTLRTKLKLAAQAEFGGIARKVAKDARRGTYTKKDEREGRGTYGQSKSAQGWTTWVRHAIEAVNEERAVGTGIAPNDYLRTFVTRGKAALERKTAEGADTELDAKGARQLKRQEEVTVGTMVRRLDLAKAKSSLKDKFAPNWSEEVFRVVKVTKQKSKGLGNASFLYRIGRTNGDAVKGSYRREELEVVPTMQDTWVGAPSKGREYIDELGLRTEGTISKWDERHNRPVRDGSTWVERDISSRQNSVLGKTTG